MGDKKNIPLKKQMIIAGAFALAVVSVFLIYYMIVEGAYQARKPLRVLFIGNSYTMYHQMPEMVEAIARSDSKGIYKLDVDKVAKDGSTLAEVLEVPGGMQKLVQGKWNYVVLQPQSEWAVNGDNLYQAYKSIRKISDIAHEGAATPVLFMTWPRQPDNAWYMSQNIGRGGMTAVTMYQKIITASNVVADKNMMGKVNVTDYWIYMLDKHPEVPMYMEDGSHPSVQASYMIALLFYKTFTQGSLADVKFMPAGVSAEQKKIILNVVENGLR